MAGSQGYKAGELTSFICPWFADDGRLMMRPVRTGFSHICMLVIRESQMAALGRSFVDQFAGKALAHVKEFFPQQIAGMGDTESLKVVHYGLQRARNYGLETESDQLRFLNVMFTLGRDFDSGQAHAWVRPILTNPAFRPAARMNVLMEELFARLFPSASDNTAPASSASAQPLPFDGIEWKDDLDSEYEPQSITPAVEPFARPPFPFTNQPDVTIEEAV